MISVRSGSNLDTTYRRLLTSEWKRTFPEEVVELLWAAVSPGQDDGDADLCVLLNPKCAAPLPAAFVNTLAWRLREAGKFVAFPEIPPPPGHFEIAQRPAKAVLQALRLATYLTLQAHAELSRPSPFFRDLQALAFQAALHFVLPDIRTKHTTEHSLLLNAAALFAVEYAAVDLAHFAYLLAQLHGYLGNNDQRLQCLHAAFRFTAPEDHSYLTKAQEYWSELLDQRRFAEAQEFLFGLHWRALPSQREEIRQMIVAALQHSNANGRVRN
jgi:hypothetical protein